MILVDTSVWVHHLRHGSDQLRAILLDEQVLCHPFIIGELACGTLKNRVEVLSLLNQLPEAQVAGHDEVLDFMYKRKFFGHGLGWIDLHLLASVVLSNAVIWTLDRRLREAFQKL